MASGSRSGAANWRSARAVDVEGVRGRAVLVDRGDREGGRLGPALHRRHIDARCAQPVEQGLAEGVPRDAGAKGRGGTEPAEGDGRVVGAAAERRLETRERARALRYQVDQGLTGDDDHEEGPFSELWGCGHQVWTNVWATCGRGVRPVPPPLPLPPPLPSSPPSAGTYLKGGHRRRCAATSAPAPDLQAGHSQSHPIPTIPDRTLGSTRWTERCCPLSGSSCRPLRGAAAECWVKRWQRTGSAASSNRT